MILYLDTSALVKRYFKEPYSEDIILRWKNASEIFTSSVTYAESLAAFYRKKREEVLGYKVIKEVTNAFRTDWQSFIRVEVTDDLNEYIDKAIESHPLRGFDAIHLASCLLVNESLSENLLFACFDRRLAHAAQVEGLETFPLNTQ
ncbi:MAG: type II toxin-antitoxin system VapC family toxin [Deltaproteobacteria bacterium]|nr:type II toxin-antitoxin system VapC family toxin [Deltaproteobacteria bacterium]